MKFRAAVVATPALAEWFRPGKQGLQPADQNRVRCGTPRRLRGSVDLDSALRSAHPNAPRWDYAIGVSVNAHSDRVVWLEVHPASSLHVGEVLRKLDWLKQWLTTDAPELKRLQPCYRWVSTGSISIRRGSPEEKRLAAKGLPFPGKSLDLCDSQARQAARTAATMRF